MNHVITTPPGVHGPSRAFFRRPGSSGWTLLFSLFAVLFLAACDDVTSPPAVEPAHITLSPSDAEIGEGEEFLFELMAPNGQTVRGVDITWASSDESVATVRNGLATGTGIGTAEISAVLPSGLGARSDIRVVRQVSGISLDSPASLNGEVGETLDEMIRARVVNSGGEPVEGGEVRFEVTKGAGSMSPVVAAADEDGWVESRWTLGPVAGEQLVELRALSDPRVRAEVAAEAAPGRADQLTVVPEQASIQPGAPFEFKAEVRDRFGNPVADIPVVWTSTDPSVIQVNEAGSVTGLRAGSAQLEAAVSENLENAALNALAAQLSQSAGRGRGNAKVDVEQGNGEGSGAQISVTSGSGQIGVVGSLLSESLEIRVTDSNGTPIRHFDVTWSVESSNGSVSEATTRTNGQGRASVQWTLGPVPGSQQVKAQVGSLGSTTFSANALVGAVESVEVSPSSVSLEEGESHTFSAAAFDKFGNPVEGGSDIAWSVSNTQVASVSSAGVVKALAEGTAQVEASLEGVKGQGALTVTALPEPEPEPEPEVEEPDEEENGDGNGSDEGSEPGKPGQVSDLGVVSSTANSITVKFTQVDDGAGQPADYHFRTALSPIKWGWGQADHVTEGSCMDPVRGTAIGQELTCVIEGLQPGTKYDLQMVGFREGSDGRRTFGTLGPPATGTTKAAAESDEPSVPVFAVELDKNELTFDALSESFELQAKALDESGATISGVTFAWTSTDQEVVTVTSSGSVLAKGVGTAMIIASAACCDAAAADTALVMVQQTVATVEVDPSSLTLEKGQTRKLTVAAKDSKGFVIPNAVVGWSSSNASVASVSADGEVRAEGEGAASVQAKAGAAQAVASVKIESISQEPPQNDGRSNRPAGMTTIGSNDGSVLGGVARTATAGQPAFGIPGFGNWWEFNDKIADVEVINDPSNPTGSGKSIRLTMSAHGVGAMATGRNLGGQPLDEMYLRVRMYLEPGNWDNGGSGNKFFYTAHWGNSHVQNHHFSRPNNSLPNEIRYDSQGKILMSAWNGWTQGEWIDLEFHLVAESSNQAGDGELHVWRNGKSIHSSTSVEWTHSNASWDPRWGGLNWYGHFSPRGGGERAGPSSYRIGELVIAGK